jgi:hypothetical protein
VSQILELLRKLYELLKKYFEGEPEPPPPPPPPPPPFGKWWPHRNDTKGVVAFPLTIRKESYVRDLCRYIRAYGYNTLSCGAQAWQKPDADETLPRGPAPGTLEWKENLERLLTITSEERVWVQLIPTFGLKWAGDRDPKAYFIELCDQVIEVVQGVKAEHVFWNVMNEFIHGSTNDYLKDEHIMELGLHLRKRTGLPVSSDAPGEIKWLDQRAERWIWKGRYPDIWQREFTHLAFHPPRNVDNPRTKKPAYKRWPNAKDYERVAERWAPRAILYNETTKFASDADMERDPRLRNSGNVALGGKGTEEERKAVIIEVKENIKAAAAHLVREDLGPPTSRFFFHSQWASIWCAEPFGWIPEY